MKPSRHFYPKLTSQSSRDKVKRLVSSCCCIGVKKVNNYRMSPVAIIVNYPDSSQQEYNHQVVWKCNVNNIMMRDDGILPLLLLLLFLL